MAALIWMLGAALCDAQDEPVLSRLSTGIALGASFPSGSSAAPGDPIYLFDDATIRAAFAMTAGYMITPDLELELTLEGLIAAGSERASRIQRERIEAAYPDYLIESSRMMQQPAFLLPSLGLSYRFRLGDLSIEPGFLACYGVVEGADLPIQLKKKGANDYRSIRHRSSGGGAFIPVPALVCRYTFKEEGYRYGLYFRAAYFNASFDTPFTTSEESLDVPLRTTSFTTHHSFQALHIALGIHLSPPLTPP